MARCIVNGATIKRRAAAQGTLTPRLVTTVISNIAAASIDGVFVNLAGKAGCHGRQ